MIHEKYDVIVVGSGMGGMCAAALAIKNGYKVLVVESLERIGGRFSTEELEGFKLFTGAHMIHYTGWVPWVFKQVGEKIDLNNISHASYILRGNEYPLPIKNRVSAFLNIINKIEVQKARLTGGIAKEVASQKILNAFRRGATVPEKERGLTLREWLLQYTDNQDAHDVFDALSTGWLIAHSWEIPASEFFKFIATMKAMNDVGTSPKGNLANMEKLARVIKTNGDIWTGSPVKAILARKGAVTGVVAKREGGEEIEISCKSVISNVGPTRTAELVGHNNYNEDYLRNMRVNIRPVPMDVIHVASDRPLVTKGGEHGGVLIMGARRLYGGASVTNTCPDLAPPGQHYLILYGNPRSTLVRMDEEEEIRQCKLDLEELFPDFEKHGRILKLDPRNIDHEFPEGRSWQAAPYQMPIETPVKNLYNVGDGALSAGYIGTSGCAESAKRAVELVKKASS